MRKRGLTLIELMVAMTIFIIVITLSVGGFVAISKVRAITGGMKETQQKVRVANEMITRFAKQAEYVTIPLGGDTLELYFDMSSAISAKKFAVDAKGDLLYSDCKTFDAQKKCTSWDPDPGNSLLGGTDKGIYLDDANVFQLSGVLPSVLNLKLDVVNSLPGYSSLSSSMLVENAVILGGLK